MAFQASHSNAHAAHWNSRSASLSSQRQSILFREAGQRNLSRGASAPTPQAGGLSGAFGPGGHQSWKWSSDDQRERRYQESEKSNCFKSAIALKIAYPSEPHCRLVAARCSLKRRGQIAAPLELSVLIQHFPWLPTKSIRICALKCKSVPVPHAYWDPLEYVCWKPLSQSQKFFQHKDNSQVKWEVTPLQGKHWPSPRLIWVMVHDWVRWGNNFPPLFQIDRKLLCLK